MWTPWYLASKTLRELATQMKMLLLPFTVTMLLAGVIQRSRLLFTQNIAIITKFREGRGKQDLVNYAVFEKEVGCDDVDKGGPGGLDG